MKNKFPDEVKYLNMIKEQLAAALDKYEESAKGSEQDYNEARQYLTDYWNEMDKIERFTNERSLANTAAAGNHMLGLRDEVKRLMDSPYFARIDFQFEDQEDAMPVYIGLFGFSGNQNQKLIYDWRAPISNMYYEYQTGPAAYEAPVGTVQGEIVRKRQIKIKEGKLEYVLESSMNIDDDILRRELSATADEKMKSIITTIQKEQNQIIRNDQADILIIQGVAGSGKTSIALHRVAYLLYRHKGRLNAQNVAIISPNKVFADYISNVLPELGEEPILELSFEEVAKSILEERISFEGSTVHAEDHSTKWLERLEYKSSPDLIQQIDQYLTEAQQRYFVPFDCTFGGVVISAEFIKKRYDAYRSVPIMLRFAKITDDILEMLKAETFRENKIPTRKEVERKLRSMFKMTGTLDLYRDFYHDQERAKLFKQTAEDVLEWPDVFPYIYMHLTVEGSAEFRSIRHLVIDEMQDYTPIQYAVIRRMFRCKKTILGDIGQSITPYHTCSAELFQQIFEKTTFVSLTKSYRSTYEIIEFARKIKTNQRIEPVERHGEQPTLVCSADAQRELAVISEKIEAFLENSYATMGILCKDMQQARRLYESLQEKYPLHLLDFESTRFENGIHITTVALSKGLEFDEVIVPFASSKGYHTEFDRNLLYIACTRAMHKLSLTCSGAVSELLPE